MEKVMVVIACGLALAFAGCSNVEKGIEGKKQSEELQEKARQNVQDLQQKAKDLDSQEKKDPEDEKPK